MKTRQAIALLTGTVLFGVHPVAGEPVTFEFAGEITYVRDHDDVLGGAVSVGSPFSGLYTFESTTEPTRPGGGFYTDAIVAVSGEVAGLPFNGPVQGISNSISVANDVISEGYDAYSVRVGVDLLGETLACSFGMRDDTGAVFTTNALPLTPPDLEFFDSVPFSLGAPSELLGLSGELTYLVPEPGTLVFLGLGGVLLAIRRHTRWMAEKASGWHTV